MITATRPKHPKREIDIDKFLQQFEKMYARSMTQEEQGMIMLRGYNQLAYHDEAE